MRSRVVLSFKKITNDGHCTAHQIVTSGRARLVQKRGWNTFVAQSILEHLKVSRQDKMFYKGAAPLALASLNFEKYFEFKRFKR